MSVERLEVESLFVAPPERRPDAEAKAGTVDQKVRPFPTRARPDPEAAPPERSDAIDAVRLVHEAAERLRASERRVAELRTTLESFTVRARQELSEARGLIRAAEDRARAAEVRAGEAERQIAEAERRAVDWEAKAQAAEAAVRAAEARSREAEARAEEAEKGVADAEDRAEQAVAAARAAERWMKRLNDAVLEQFSEDLAD